MRRFPIISAAEKPAILLTTVFSRSSGENSRNRTDRMPSRAIGKRAGATVYAAHRPSRKYATFKLGSNGDATPPSRSSHVHSMSSWRELLETSHSITSSAVESRDCGNDMPSVFVVVKLSDEVESSRQLNGQFVGLGPF